MKLPTAYFFDDHVWSFPIGCSFPWIGPFPVASFFHRTKSPSFRGLVVSVLLEGDDVMGVPRISEECNANTSLHRSKNLTIPSLIIRLRPLLI